MNKNNRDQFERRFSSFQIPKSELDRMYERELEFQMHLQWMAEQALANQRGGVTSSPTGGGQEEESQQPGYFFMTVNTSLETDFQMEFDILTDVNYIFTWGDGTSEEGTLSSGTGVNISHSYPDPNEEYFAELCFLDPTAVGRIEIYSNRISAFSGLQQFTSLVEFEADNNFLESADFSGMTSLIDIDISDCSFVGGGDSLSTVNLIGCNNLEILFLDDSDFSGGIPDISGLTSLKDLDLDDCAITGTVDLSSLSSLERFDLSQNPGLSGLTIISSQPLGGGSGVQIYDCALGQSYVDNILIALSQNGISNGYVDISGGTNSPPSASGLSAKTVLESNGWVVVVN